MNYFAILIFSAIVFAALVVCFVMFLQQIIIMAQGNFDSFWTLFWIIGLYVSLKLTKHFFKEMIS